MKWKKRVMSLALVSCMAATAVTPMALAGDGLEELEFPTNPDYVVVKETKYSLDYESGNYSESYEYKYDYVLDDQGRVIRQTGYYADVGKDEGDVSEWEYDAQGRVIREVNPWEGTFTYEYNEHGQLVTETNTSAISESGDEYEQRITQYLYDSEGNRIESNTSYSYSSQTEQVLYHYNDGRLIREEHTFTPEEGWGDTETTIYTYEYDSTGNIVKHSCYYIDENGEEYLDMYSEYEYDDNGHPVKWTVITPPYGEDPMWTELVWTRQYDDNGNLIRETYYDSESLDDVSGYKVYEYKKLSELENPSVTEVFSDIPANAWYIPYVQSAYDNGLMSGTSDTTFEPNSPLTRAMVAQILYAHAGKPEVTGASPFTDVANSKAWYYNAVVWANQNGIVNGYDDNTFRPMTNVTREQLAVMLYAHAGKPEATGSLSGFADAGQVHSWAEKAMLWANQNGIISGSESNGKRYLKPQGNATRAEAATMLTQYLKDK